MAAVPKARMHDKCTPRFWLSASTSRRLRTAQRMGCRRTGCTGQRRAALIRLNERAAAAGAASETALLALLQLALRCGKPAAAPRSAAVWRQLLLLRPQQAGAQQSCLRGACNCWWVDAFCFARVTVLKSQPLQGHLPVCGTQLDLDETEVDAAPGHGMPALR